jgi:hypothetical protein
MSRSTQQVPNRLNGFDDDVLQLCAAAYGFKVRQIGKDSSHASRISHEKAFLPRSIHGLLFIFLYRGRRKQLWAEFQTISVGLLEGVGKTQQHFPGEAPNVRGFSRGRSHCSKWYADYCGITASL